MPSTLLKLAPNIARHSFSQLFQLRRQMLRYARSLPLGSPERNDRRQIASSLRSLLRDKKSLGVHTVERPQSGNVLVLPTTKCLPVSLGAQKRAPNTAEHHCGEASEQHQNRYPESGLLRFGWCSDD